MIISVTSGVLLCLLIVVARWIFIRRKPSKDESSEQGKAPAQFKTSNTGETTITNGFSADDISEIDADIDLTTPLPMSTGSSSITRNDVSQYSILYLSMCLYSHWIWVLENVVAFVCYRRSFLLLFVQFMQIYCTTYVCCTGTTNEGDETFYM